MTVSLIFTAPPTLLHRIIRWFTGNDATHVMIGYSDQFWGGDWTAAADLDGVRLYQAEQTCKNVIARYACKFDMAAGVESVASIINQSYDFVDLFAIGWVVLMWRVFKRRVRHPWRNSRAQICSEFVTRFLQGCKAPEVDTWNPEATTPGDVRSYCDRHPELFEPLALT